MKITPELWGKLGGKEQDMLLQAAMMTPPVSFDTLFHTLACPPTTILRTLEKLDTLGLIKPSRARGTGFYRFAGRANGPDILAHADQEQLAANARALIDYYHTTLDQGPEKWCRISHCYHLSHLPLDHPGTVIRAAGHCMAQNNIPDAFTYFHLVVSHFSPAPPKTAREKQLYLEAAVGLCASSEDRLPLSAQEKIADQALDCAQAPDTTGLHARALIFKARAMMRQGDFKGADTYYETALAITAESKDPGLKKWISAYRSDIEIWRGQISQAVRKYENLVGNLEELPSNALLLKAFSRLGWSYGICGDIYRGLGLVNVVRKKAVDLKIRYIEVYAELMKLMILADSRRIEEARASLDVILQYPETELDHYVLWAAYGKKAYFAFLDNDIKAAWDAYRISLAHSRELECPHYHGTDNLEYLYAFEKDGLHPSVFRDELEKVLAWPDIYTRGAALRYRAMYAMADNTGDTDIRADLEQAIELLTAAGARVELAQAQVFLARFLLAGRDDQSRVQALLKAAWEVFSEVNTTLFPEELKHHLEEQDSETLLVDTIVEVGNTLAQTRNRSKLLAKMVKVIIRLAGAERCGIFLLDKTGAPRLESSRNLEPDTVDREDFKLSAETIHKVISTGKRSVSFGRFAAFAITGRISENGWMVCDPIVLRKKILGVLYLDNSFSALPLPKHRLALLRAIGNQIAVSLDNVDAYERITRLRNRLEAETHFYRKENQKPDMSGRIIGESPGIQKVITTIREVARSDATVLINGETGVGKELAARAIHTFSHRNEGPFIPINIATISPDLVYSELFGHAKGAFTGAVRKHVGRFELAHGGSFFMDDVDGLSPEIQVKLLRVLQEREFQRVGDTRTLSSDFRLIAATNQDLTTLVSKGKFRSDFYYRLNVVPITIPPLRERKQDIPLLAAHFLAMFCKKNGKTPPHHLIQEHGPPHGLFLARQCQGTVPLH
ncbi:MAG: sigma 54-interacting transcriptional regulator [Desulfobacter sp.]